MKQHKEELTGVEGEELKDFISELVKEVQTELGPAASIDAIEAALLQRQSQVMSRLLEELVKDQDFPPTGT
jgi:hypothetical protein